jgi:hypothetical protein
MRKDLTKILNKLYAIEILQAIPEVSDDFVGPPEPPKERILELWEIFQPGAYEECRCLDILKNNRIPAITIYGTTRTEGDRVFPDTISSISLQDVEAAFNTNQMQNFLAKSICEKYNAPVNPQRAKEVLAFIEDWFRTAELGLNRDEIEQLPNPEWFDDGIWDLLGRIEANDNQNCISLCLLMSQDLFKRLNNIARNTQGVELWNSVPSLDPKGVQRPDPFWGAGYPALKTIMEKLISCIKEKLRRAIQDGTIA